jgi:hypothetical protein
MPLAEHHGMIKTFAPDRTDQPFSMSSLLQGAAAARTGAILLDFVIGEEDQSPWPDAPVEKSRIARIELRPPACGPKLPSKGCSRAAGLK